MARIDLVQQQEVGALTGRRLLDLLNGPGHKVALQWLLVLTIGHWLEHLFQAFELFVLGWPTSRALGALGLIWPALVTSEWLHYVIALIMLVALIMLRPGFRGEARGWWNVALGIQVWHHAEHALLLGQALTGHPLFGASVPTSLLQLVFPRVELHLFYNAAVTLPMLAAMLEHRRPTPGRSAPGRHDRPMCTCAVS